jgi:hypothetical protein
MSGNISNGTAAAPAATSTVSRDHERPASADGGTVEAVGRLTEALEWVERARGRLYDFHQMMGHADYLFEEAADALESSGHAHLAAGLRTHLVGRNVLEGRWTFQVVEEFDDLYHAEARRFEELVRNELMGGRRHVFEAELKERRRTRGLRGHEASPRISGEEASMTAPFGAVP